MKRLIALLLCAGILFSLAGCVVPQGIIPGGDLQPGEDNGGSEEGENPDTSSDYVKMEDIAFSSDFSEGLAVVALRADKENYYVIDKSGKIIFTIENTDLANNAISQANNLLGASLHESGGLYENGKMLFFDGIIYDKTGKATAPESVGATEFLELKDGEYIVAKKVTSDYASSKTEVGVLNMDLEWVVPLAEENEELYYRSNAEFWGKVPGFSASEEVFDFSEITNHRAHTPFVNGKAAVIMYNSVTREFYVSAVDKQGNFLFEPVKMPCSHVDSLGPMIRFDGEIIVASGRYNGSLAYSMEVFAYNLNGEQVGAFDTRNLSQCSSNSDAVKCDFYDGVVVFRVTHGTYSAYYRQSEVIYYTYEFEKLFSN